MKKILTLLLAFTLLISMSIPVCASSPIANETSGLTSLTYSVASKYYVTIPSSIPITNKTGSGIVKVNAGSLIAANKTLKFTITGATNYTESKFYLNHTVSENVLLEYSIKKADETAVVKDTPFLQATAEQAYAGKQETLTFTTVDAVSAGDYEGTVTISIGEE